MISRLLRDRRGVTVIEFAIVAPVMLLMIMGFIELTYQTYVQSVLSGAVRKAGRDAAIELDQTHYSTMAAKWNVIDTNVLSFVNSVAARATIVSSSHVSYSGFSNVKVPEPFSDNNNNGVYDPTTDCFTDINGNGTWDTDQGSTNSQGGASDVTYYTLRIQYPRLFPIPGWFGWSSIAQLKASTVMKNQPFTTQSAATPKTCCPSTGCS